MDRNEGRPDVWRSSQRCAAHIPGPPRPDARLDAGRATPDQLEYEDFEEECDIVMSDEAYRVNNELTTAALELNNVPNTRPRCAVLSTYNPTAFPGQTPVFFILHSPAYSVGFPCGDRTGNPARYVVQVEASAAYRCSAAGTTR